MMFERSISEPIKKKGTQFPIYHIRVTWTGNPMFQCGGIEVELGSYTSSCFSVDSWSGSSDGYRSDGTVIIQHTNPKREWKSIVKGETEVVEWCKKCGEWTYDFGKQANIPAIIKKLKQELLNSIDVEFKEERDEYCKNLAIEESRCQFYNQRVESAKAGLTDSEINELKNTLATPLYHNYKGVFVYYRSSDIQELLPFFAKKEHRDYVICATIAVTESDEIIVISEKWDERLLNADDYEFIKDHVSISNIDYHRMAGDIRVSDLDFDVDLVDEEMRTYLISSIMKYENRLQLVSNLDELIGTCSLDHFKYFKEYKYSKKSDFSTNIFKVN